MEPETKQLKLRIEQKPETKGHNRVLSQDLRIFINDVEQTHIKSLELRVDALKVVTAALVVFPTEIECDAEVLASLTTPQYEEPETNKDKNSNA